MQGKALVLLPTIPETILAPGCTFEPKLPFDQTKKFSLWRITVVEKIFSRWERTIFWESERNARLEWEV